MSNTKDDKTYDNVNGTMKNNCLPYYDKLQEEKNRLLQPARQEMAKQGDKVNIIFTTNGAGGGAASTCNNPHCECNKDRKRFQPISMSNILNNMRLKTNIEDSDDEFDKITLSSHKNSPDEFIPSEESTPSEIRRARSESIKHHIFFGNKNNSPTETRIQQILRNQRMQPSSSSSSSISSVSMDSATLRYIQTGNVRRRIIHSDDEDDTREY